MINYDSNFLRFIYKNKNRNKNNYIEANIERNGISKIRFLKPRIDFTSTKKIFEYKYFRIFNINTLFNNIEVYGKIKLELDNFGTYFKNIKLKKKKNIKSNIPWYITYNYIKCIQNYLFLKKKKKRKIKKIKIKTIIYAYNKFKNIHINIKKKYPYFYKMRFTRTIPNFRNNVVMLRNFKGFIIEQRQKILLTTFRIKKGIFWGIFNLLNKIIKETKLFIKKFKKRKIKSIILKKYIILKSFIFYITKLSFFTLKRASFRYLYFAKHLIIFFYNSLSKNILLYKQNNIVNDIINKKVNNNLFMYKRLYNIDYLIFSIIFSKEFEINDKKLFYMFNIYILLILYIEKRVFLFNNIKNNIKLTIDLYRKKKGQIIPAHFLDFVKYKPYFKYKFKRLFTNFKLEKRYKRKGIALNNDILRLNRILFNV